MSWRRGDKGREYEATHVVVSACVRLSSLLPQNPCSALCAPSSCVPCPVPPTASAQCPLHASPSTPWYVSSVATSDDPSALAADK
jgi:hypothetical protein